MTLARGAARGAAWNFATVVVERSLGFAILVVLLRHVSADAVGIVAIASSITEIGRLVTAGGAGEQVVAAPGDRDVEAGAFYAQLLLASAGSAMLFAAAPLLAGAFHAPALLWVTRALTLTLLLGCFVIVPSARLVQRLGFRTLGLMSVGATLCGGAAALALVFTGHDLAALVSQRVVGAAFYAVAVSVATGWSPPAPPRVAILLAALRFNLPLMAAAFVDYVARSGYVVLVGLRLPIAAVGEFRIAQRLAEVLQEVAVLPVGKVFLPVFVSVRAEPNRRFSVARDLTDALAIGAVGLAAVAGAAARPLVLLMFGLRWAHAVPVFALISLAIPSVALYALAKPMLVALQRPGLASAFSALDAASMVAIVLGVAPLGLLPLSAAIAARGLLAGLVLLPALSTGVGRSAWPLLRLFAGPLIALGIARLAAALALSAVPAASLVTELVVAGGIAGGAYFGTLSLISWARLVAIVLRVGRAFGIVAETA